MGKIRIVGPVINHRLKNGTIKNPETHHAGTDFGNRYRVLQEYGDGGGNWFAFIGTIVGHIHSLKFSKIVYLKFIDIHRPDEINATEISLGRQRSPRIDGLRLFSAKGLTGQAE